MENKWKWYETFTEQRQQRDITSVKSEDFCWCRNVWLLNLFPGFLPDARGETQESSIPAVDGAKAEEWLSSVRTEFVNRVSGPNLNQLLDELLQLYVISDAEKESLNSRAVRADKARDMIDTVQKKGRKACSILIAAIRKVDSHLFIMLNSMAVKTSTLHSLRALVSRPADWLEITSCGGKKWQHLNEATSEESPIKTHAEMACKCRFNSLKVRSVCVWTLSKCGWSVDSGFYRNVALKNYWLLCIVSCFQRLKSNGTTYNNSK